MLGSAATGEKFRVQASGPCSECGRSVEGWIAFSRDQRVVGSEGFMVCAKGLMCDDCLAKRGEITSEQARR
jgi:hypothetical protein